MELLTQDQNPQWLLQTGLVSLPWTLLLADSTVSSSSLVAPTPAAAPLPARATRRAARSRHNGRCVSPPARSGFRDTHVARLSTWTHHNLSKVAASCRPFRRRVALSRSRTRPWGSQSGAPASRLGRFPRVDRRCTGGREPAGLAPDPLQVILEDRYAAGVAVSAEVLDNDPRGDLGVQSQQLCDLGL